MDPNYDMNDNKLQAQVPGLPVIFLEQGFYNFWRRAYNQYKKNPK